MKTIDFIPNKQIPIIDSADVVVVGGGPSGTAAALAAAQSGSRVIIIEKTGFCGGTAAMGLPIQGFDYADGRPLVRGIAWKLYRRLADSGGALSSLLPCHLHNPYAIIDPDQCTIEIQRMLDESKVSVWLHTHFLHAVFDERRHISYVITGGKGGLSAISGKFWIDATGDGDLAVDMGIPFTVGRESDSIPQSATLNFSLSHVNLRQFGKAADGENRELFDTHPLLNRKAVTSAQPHIMVGMRNIIEKAQKESGIKLPASFVSYITGTASDTVTINMTHIPHAMGHTIEGLSKAEQDGRRQIEPIWRFFRQWVPGFEHAVISRIASHVGIRESRHITGIYTLTEKDVTSGTFFPDTIAVGGYPIDIHNPEKGDVYLQRVPPYGIPFRCMQIEGYGNLLVTGRALSAEHTALASCRLIATCMAMGEAAGTAAHLALENKLELTPIDTREVRKILLARGAVLETSGLEPDIPEAVQ